MNTFGGFGIAYALPVGDSWRVDETYIKVRGQWVMELRG